MLALPSELFSQLLSFLPPQGIAASSAICRQWRASITSNPVLHRDIDLTGMGLGSEMEDVIRHFSRLSSLALHQVVKVSVDLSSFWEDFERIPIEEKDWERTGFNRLLQLLLDSRRTLREISFKIDAETVNDSLPLLILFVNQLVSFTKLKRVRIEAPVVLSLEAGGELEGSKRFELINTRRNKKCKNTSEVPDLMSKVENFAGTVFTNFTLERLEKFQPGVRLRSKQVLERLRSSRFTLRTLDFSCLQYEGGRNLWGFSVSCPHLISLTIFLTPQESEENMNLEIAEHTLVGGIKHLDISVRRYLIDFTGLSDWMGRRVEELRLCGLRAVQDGNPPPPLTIPGEAFTSIILGSRRTLRYIRLSNIDIVDSKSVASFPSLEQLHVLSSSPSVYRWFTDMQYPRLSVLGLMWTRGQGNIEGVQDGFHCLLSLLCLHHHNLRMLNFDHRGLPPPIIIPSSVVFIFSNLLALSISSEDGTVANRFSSYLYPQLERLRASDDVKFKFLKNSPKLRWISKVAQEEG